MIQVRRLLSKFKFAPTSAEAFVIIFRRTIDWHGVCDRIVMIVCSAFKESHHHTSYVTSAEAFVIIFRRAIDWHGVCDIDDSAMSHHRRCVIVMIVFIAFAG